MREQMFDAEGMTKRSNLATANLGKQQCCMEANSNE